MVDTPTPARPALDASELADTIEAALCKRHDNDTHCLVADCDGRYKLTYLLISNAPALVAALRALADMRGALAKIAEARDPLGDQTRFATCSQLREYAVEALARSAP
jgi:hypothetical protein